MGHPRPIDSDSVTHGRNAEHPGYADTKYVHCANCGFVCHMDRDMHAPDGSRAGDGIDHASTTFVTTDASTMAMMHIGTDGTTDMRSEPVVTQGCPMCGCLRYDQPLEKG